MKITVKRTGGYAGLTEDVAAIDTAQLDTVTVQRVEQMLESNRFFDLPAIISGDIIGADLPRYEITVTEGDQQHTVTFFCDDKSPEAAPLHGLVQTLSQMGGGG